MSARTEGQLTTGRSTGAVRATRAVTGVDIAIAAALVLIAVVGTGAATANQAMGAAPAAAIVLAVLAAVAVVGRRAAPMTTFAVVGALAAGYIGAGYAFGPILISLVVAAYGLASRLPIRPVLLWSGGLAVALAVATVVRVVVQDVGDWADYPRVVGWLVVPIAVGIAIQIRRRATVEVRDAQVRRAASEERLRMAQDLHDVVGHGLAVIAMQAGVALHVLDRDPAKARESLEAIRATSREALDGLRGELAVLTATGDRSGESAPRRPTPSLADLDVLLDRVRAGGLRVDADVDVPAGLSTAVDGAAFRIVQESLTNVLRHSGAADARVRVGTEGGSLMVEVTDTGAGDPRAPAPPGTGRHTSPRAAQASAAAVDTPPATPAAAGTEGTGIAGMRSRATAVGGTLTAGPRSEGGFAVRAWLPLGRTSTTHVTSPVEARAPADAATPADPAEPAEARPPADPTMPADVAASAGTHPPADAAASGEARAPADATTRAGDVPEAGSDTLPSDRAEGAAS